MSSSSDAAYKQGQNDKSQGKQAADTSKMTANERDKYLTGYNSGKK